jgi:CHAT domain-containing protein
MLSVLIGWATLLNLCPSDLPAYRDQPDQWILIYEGANLLSADKALVSFHWNIFEFGIVGVERSPEIKNWIQQNLELSEDETYVTWLPVDEFDLTFWQECKTSAQDVYDEARRHRQIFQAYSISQSPALKQALAVILSEAFPNRSDALTFLDQTPNALLPKAHLFIQAKKLSYLAAAALDIGKHQYCEQNLLAALSLYRNFEDRHRIGDTLRELGFLNTVIERFKQARIYFQDALNHFTPFTRRYMRISFELGWLALQQGRIAEAVDTFEKVVAFYESLEDPEYLIGTYDRFGTILLAAEAFQRSESYYRKALAIVKAGHGYPFDEANLHANLSNLYLQKGLYFQATLYADRALQLYPVNSKPESVIWTQNIKAKALVGLKNPSAAVYTHEEAFKLMLQLRSETQSGGLNRAFFDAALKQLENYLDSIWQLSHQNPEIAQRALVTYEIIRSSGLIKKLEPTGKKQLSKNKVSSKIAEVIQNRSHEKDILVYFFGSSHIYWWFLSKGQWSFDRISEAQQVEGEISAYLAAIKAPMAITDIQAKNLSKSLKTRLITSIPLIQPDSKRLVILADGPLQRLPFCILLGDSAAISYITNLSSLEKEQVNKLNQALLISDPVFGLSDKRLNHLPREGIVQADDFFRLSASAAETESLSAQLKHLGITHQRKNGFDARLDSFLDLDLEEYQLLHFATHAFAIPESPEQSGLIFSLVDNAGNSLSGYLKLSLIAELSIPANLIVLSACQSGDGAIFTGMSSLSLAQSFLYAGSGAVLATLWEVDDEATKEFMSVFYEQLLNEGKSAASALRAAQNKIKAIPHWQSPKHWAGFVLIGKNFTFSHSPAPF